MADEFEIPGLRPPGRGPGDITSDVGKEEIRILLVDDNPGDARLVQELLAQPESRLFIWKQVGSLRDALDELARDRFDVALVDLVLPDANGADIVSHLLDAEPSLPVVALSSSDSEEFAINVMRLGVQDYLQKGEGNGVTLARALRYAIERKRMQQKLLFLAQYDHLTGLPNRALFHDRLARALERARRTNVPLALLFLDLDRFKLINDSLGHHAGDRLLKVVAERLMGCVRSDDTVARLGGDEFLLALQHVTAVEHAALVAEKMLRALSTPIRVGGIDVTVSASIGIAAFPRDGGDADTLLKNADAAMYRAKDKGRNNYQFYEPEMNARAYERLALENALRRALADQEFLLQYQPVRNLLDGRVTGLEALVRWAHPERGTISPSEFVPLMEESGLIVPVGEWVLRTACRQYRTWRARGLPPLRLKVNFSARQLWQADLVSKITDVLEDERVNPSCVVLEITEGALMENTEASRTLLHALRNMRLQISVDDFGTGYSSLGYLKRFPISSLKIDRSFVRDVPADPDSMAIVRAIIDLAHHLRMRVVAEGVETPAQLEFLRRHGCDEAQGFYLSRPLPPEAVLEHCLGESNLLQGP